MIRPDGSIDVRQSSAPTIYTVIEAASLEEAIEQARRCPFLDLGVAVEVSRIAGMVGGRRG
ncbi:MAG: hypothetical protein U5K56_13575 [Halioglobus sp.]|nr:hypothetical protein [Halioglobus sp.]